MSVYHQMGHDSINLVDTKELSDFAGAIISPVNYNEAQVLQHIAKIRHRTSFEWLFDPQLYYPRSDRGELPGWSYFPSNVDTVDISSEAWWSGVVAGVVETCTRLRPSAACSPAFAAPVYTDDYYAMMVSIGNEFSGALRGTGIDPVQTVIVNLADLSQQNRAMEIATVVSRTLAQSIFLIYVSDTAPRREVKDPTQLVGGMRLINALERAGLPVTVGYSSSESILWKYAGATHLSTGKFFNLRRFTKTRFEEPTEGGGQLPYWFEENLLAFLRESDVVRAQRENLLSERSLANPFAAGILGCIGDAKAWLGLSWRFYMYAFCDLESRVHIGQTPVPDLLLTAERNWMQLEDQGILMEEPRNDGSWIRPWRQAAAEARRLLGLP